MTYNVFGGTLKALLNPSIQALITDIDTVATLNN